MVILGIDPGTATTGFGALEIGKTTKCIDCGFIKTDPRFSMPERLIKIHRELDALLKKHQPKFVAVENIYFFKNLKTALPVSQAKGVILFTIAKRKIPIFEFTPLQVKMTITGYGKADKKQVKGMVFSIFPELKNFKDSKNDDAIDAVAIAYCCASAIKSKLAKAVSNSFPQ